MTRRHRYSGTLGRMARESARAMRDAQRAAARAQREQNKASRELQRQAKNDYLAGRLEESEEINEDIRATVTRLQGLLEEALNLPDTVSFDALRLDRNYPAYKSKNSFLLHEPKEPGFFARLFGLTKRYELQYELFQRARAEFDEQEGRFRAEYEQERQSHLTKVSERDAQVEDFKKAYFEREPDAVRNFCLMVLDHSLYPDDFPHLAQLAYEPDSKLVVVDYELPTIEVVPPVEEVKYIKTKDEIVEKARKPKEIREIYQDVVTAIAIRTIHELIQSDKAGTLDAVAFSGFVRTHDPATGNAVQPYLISVRATKQEFSKFDLRHINKAACLRNLGAAVSARPDELIPVKPIVEFNMFDKRFIEESDVLSELDMRPNLMDLTPTAFENLVSNLFGKMGLEAKLTRSHRDGGVDVVAFDCRPVLGGKVVIQAKRYRHTVGVSAVRDLYGTMQHEGANKGILVATSGFGPDAFEFAKDKPIELIPGGQLLFLLNEIGVAAKIVMPEDV